MSDERLRLTYDRLLALRAEVTTDRQNCPSVETMLAILRREGTDGPRVLMLDHVMGCPFCQPEFELLRTVGRASVAETRPE